MIKYRLKEEVKQYLKVDADNALSNIIESMEWWILNTYFSFNALEEVEEKKIEVIRIDNNKRLQKTGNIWTEQERADIEKFLNTFGSWENMLEMIDKHVSDEDYWCSMPVNKNKKQEDFNFQDWLKEKGSD